MYILWPALPSIVMSENAAVVVMRTTCRVIENNYRHKNRFMEMKISHFTIITEYMLINCDTRSPDENLQIQNVDKFFL